MTCSTLPLRVGPLALLLRERAISDALDAYAHDIQWSILCSIHGMCGSKCSAPSYSSMVERVRGRNEDPQQKQDIVKEVNDSVQAMIDMFLPGKRGEKSETI